MVAALCAPLLRRRLVIDIFGGDGGIFAFDDFRDVLGLFHLRRLGATFGDDMKLFSANIRGLGLSGGSACFFGGGHGQSITETAKIARASCEWSFQRRNRLVSTYLIALGIVVTHECGLDHSV